MARTLDTISILALKALDHGFLDMSDLFDFFMSRALEGSAYRLSKEGYKTFKKRSWQRRVALNAANQEREDKKRFYNLIYRLHVQGLITKTQKGMDATLSITKKGTEKFRATEHCLARETKTSYPHGTPTRYEKKKAASSIIVSFDIPEKEKSKRNWLRSVLRNLDYEMLHESVWIGTNKLPKDFMEEYRHMNMTKYIHIFSVVKKGTIGE